jgi:uncharacterized protein YkwD
MRARVTACLRALVLGWAALTAARLARADVLSVLESARHGCPRGAALGSLRPVAQLDGAARWLADGASLHQATARASYRTLASASIHVAGDSSEAGLARLLDARFCRTLTDPELREVGIHRRGAELWIVLAAPFVLPALADAARADARVLELVNRARSRPRQCGAESFAAAPPLTLSARLYAAALAHSRDMAAQGDFAHSGSNGSTPAERVSQTGYAWSHVGENIAAGAASADEVTQGWLASPEHCANIMDPRFTESAVAFRIDARSPAGVYWTQLFARPR